jgi:hypothetical protein
MLFKMFVPVCFQVLPIFRLEIAIFAELWSVLWFWSLSGPIYWLFRLIFHSLRLNKSYLTSIESLKYIIKCLYQIVLKFSQFLDPTLPYLLNYYRFYDFDPSQGLFLAILRYFHSSRLNKSKLASIEYLKCIIKCLYQLVFKFGQFSDSKLTYLLNYCRFCDFDPFQGHFLAILRPFAHFEAKYIKFDIYRVLEMYYKMFVPISFQVWPIFRLKINIFVELLPILWFWPFSGTIFGHFASFCTLKMNKSNFTSIECSKCILKCVYQLVFKFSQFLDSKLTYLLN